MTISRPINLLQLNPDRYNDPLGFLSLDELAILSSERNLARIDQLCANVEGYLIRCCPEASSKHWYREASGRWFDWNSIPRYAYCLNAMYELESSLSVEQAADLRIGLRYIVRFGGGEDGMEVHAPAHARAAAYIGLRTNAIYLSGKYEEALLNGRSRRGPKRAFLKDAGIKANPWR